MRFQEFSKFIIKPHLFENKQQYKQIMDTMVNADIISQEKANEKLKEVRTLLKRADRIIWWLRWFRIKRTGEVIDAKIQEVSNKWDARNMPNPPPDAPQSEEEMKQQVQQLENLYKKITKKDFDFYVDIEVDLNFLFQGQFNILALGNHWSIMFEQSPQVNAVEWEANLNPAELLRRLQEAEKEWKQKQREEIEPEPDDQIIIDYGKYAWVKLDRSYCELEGRAMGHCGNTATPQEGDRILSFRTKVSDTRQKPHLTFILDRHGYLGEMKGRGNDKPSEKYHPYIIDLLQKDFVRGIKGGGYLPENNFDIEDLDDDIAEKLIDEKPALGGLVTVFEKQGVSDALLDMLESQLDNAYLDYEGVERSGESSYIIVDDFTLEQIRDSISVHGTVSDLIDIAMGDDYNFIDNIGNMVASTFGSGGYAEELFDDLDEDTQEKIKKYAKKDAGENVDVDDFEDIMEESGYLREIFESALFDGILVGTNTKVEKFLNEWLTENNFKQTRDSEKYYLLTVPVSSLIAVMEDMNIRSISDIDVWGDILYKISPIEEPTIDVENVYAYDEDVAKKQLQESIEEMTEKLDAAT